MSGASRIFALHTEERAEPRFAIFQIWKIKFDEVAIFLTSAWLRA